MTTEELKNLAVSMAIEAEDQADEYESPYDSYSQNLCDTITEKGGSHEEKDYALSVFTQKCKRLGLI